MTQSNIQNVSIDLSSQVILAKMKLIKAEKEKESVFSRSASAVYQIEKYVADTLIAAKPSGDNTFVLPNMHMTIKLKKGVRLIDWVERYMMQKYKGSFDAIKRNKDLWGK